MSSGRRTRKNWLFIGCYHNGTTLITKVDLGDEGDNKILDSLRANETRATIYSTLQAAYDLFSQSEKDTINQAITEAKDRISKYANANADESKLENDGNYFKSAFSNFGAWDPKTSQKLASYYSRYFDLDKVVNIIDSVQMESDIQDIIHEQCGEIDFEKMTAEKCDQNTLAEKMKSYYQYDTINEKIFSLKSDNLTSKSRCNSAVLCYLILFLLLVSQIVKFTRKT